jgi:hypothetical protein
MGTTREEIRLPEFRNRTNFLIPVYCLLSTLIGYTLSGPITRQSTVNETLKLCNQKPLECKFKYDILMYNETGRVPYKEPINTKKDSKES